MNHPDHNCCAGNRGVGIVNGNVQQIGHIFPAQTAIRYGTLYPELNKPMVCAAAPSGCAEPSARQTIGFSAWEVRLYLNTHPDDRAALQLYHQLCQQLKGTGYACAFVPCNGNARWNWVDDPWPWEFEANGGRA